MQVEKFFVCLFLVCFSSVAFAHSNPNSIQLVYRVMSIGLVPPEGATRYELNRAVMRMISKHADLFAEYLTESCEKFFVLFTQGPKALCRHTNKDLRVAAYKALDAFLKQVNGQLCSGKRDPEINMSNFRFFVKKFFEMIRGWLGLIDFFG